MTTIGKNLPSFKISQSRGIAYHEEPQFLWQQLLKYGTNSHSFLSLYKGYRYFKHKEENITGVLPFVNTAKAWVGAGDPIAESNDALKILEAFFETAQTEDKQGLVLPVGAQLAQEARKRGWGTVQIGVEPVFEVNKREISVNDVTVASRLYSKGALVTSFNPKTIDFEQRETLDNLVNQWLASRKMAALQFLNKVEPWEFPQWKRYFKISYEGRIRSFLAAVPIPSKKGWYLVDIFKSPEAPVGTNELLILKTIEALTAEGAQFFSLGFSPLANLNPMMNDQHKLLHHLLTSTFSYGNFFYDFKSLYQFKMKFNPTHVEPHFLVFNPPQIRWSTGFSILDASLGRSLSSALWSGLDRYWNRYRWVNVLKKFLDEDLILRVSSESIMQKLMRVRFSIIYIICYQLVFQLREHSLFGEATHLAFLLESVPFSIGALILEYLLGTPIYLLPIFLSALLSFSPLNPLLGLSAVMGGLIAIGRRQKILFPLGLAVVWFFPFQTIVPGVVFTLGYLFTRLYLWRGVIYYRKA